jgi:hypothetical protein
MMLTLDTNDSTIKTTRKTGGLHSAYKAYVPASVSRRWLLWVKAKLHLPLLPPL